MPRRKIPFTKNSFHHVYSRGNRKGLIFLEERDYVRFLEKTEEYRRKYAVDIICFCLLPNHFHFLLKQKEELSLSRFLGTLLNSHARYFAVKHELPPGHVFQGRFGAKLIKTDEDLLQVSRYIHLNPIKEKIFSLLEGDRRKKGWIRNLSLFESLRTYPWSSYRNYLYGKITPVTLNATPIFSVEKNAKQYQNFVESRLTSEDLSFLADF